VASREPFVAEPRCQKQGKNDTETPLNCNCSKEAFCKIWAAQQATWRKRIETGFSISCSFIQILCTATAVEEEGNQQPSLASSVNYLPKSGNSRKTP